MIDFVKILLFNIDVDRLLNTFSFFEEICSETGETKNKKVCSYHHCTITIYPSGVVIFKGSIHKLYNSLFGIKAPLNKTNGFNGNQFNLDNILYIKNHLSDLLHIEPRNMIFQNIEFGVNTQPNFDPQLFITGLLFHNGKIFESRFNQFYGQVEHQRYLIKIYNKSNQYGMHTPTLRVEIKIKKIEDIKHLGIRSFEDINESTLNKAKGHLLKRFDEVVYYDNTIVKKRLSKSLKNLIRSYKNSKYWINDLKSNQRDRHKKRLKRVIKTNSKNLHLQIRNEIDNKCVIINRKSTNSKCVIINHSSIELNTKQPYRQSKNKTCPILLVKYPNKNYQEDIHIHLDNYTLKWAN